MNDLHKAIVGSVREKPGELTDTSALADFLIEQGEDDRAELVRVQWRLEHDKSLQGEEREAALSRETQLKKLLLPIDVPSMSWGEDSDARAKLMTFSNGYADAKDMTPEALTIVQNIMQEVQQFKERNASITAQEFYDTIFFSFFTNAKEGLGAEHFKMVLKAAVADGYVTNLPSRGRLPPPLYYLMLLNSPSSEDNYTLPPQIPAEMLRMLVSHGMDVNNANNLHKQSNAPAHQQENSIWRYAVRNHCPVETLKVLIEAGVETNVEFLSDVGRQRPVTFAQFAGQQNYTGPEIAEIEKAIREVTSRSR